MQTCGSCFGTGKVSCSACGGTGRKSRLTGGGELEINSCLVCYGSGRMRCDFCGGQGKISGAVSAHAPTPLSKQSIAEEMYHKAIALWSGTGYRDPNSAIELFTHALNIDPNNSNTYHARGLAYHQLGRYTAALNDYGRAINLYPDDAEYYNARGNTYYAMNKLAKAKQDWEKACEMGSKQACENLERL